MESMRKNRLRQWMIERDITYLAVAKQIDVSLSTASRLLNGESMPVKKHEKLLKLGFPAELLPMPLDKKPGPKAREPRFPVPKAQ